MIPLPSPYEELLLKPYEANMMFTAFTSLNLTVTVHGAYDFPGIATLQRGKVKDARLEPGVPRKHRNGTGQVYAPNRMPRERLHLAFIGESSFIQ